LPSNRANQLEENWKDHQNRAFWQSCYPVKKDGSPQKLSFPRPIPKQIYLMGVVTENTVFL
jgi:hypothetical protein